MKLHQNRQKLPTFQLALSWLRTVAIRQAVDNSRRNSRRRRREARASIQAVDTTCPGEHAELQESIAAGLLRLKEMQREAIALVYFEEVDRNYA